jgi:hypothetical protein
LNYYILKCNIETVESQYDDGSMGARGCRAPKSPLPEKENLTKNRKKEEKHENEREEEMIGRTGGNKRIFKYFFYFAQDHRSKAFYQYQIPRGVYRGELGVLVGLTPTNHKLKTTNQKITNH